MYTPPVSLHIAYVYIYLCTYLTYVPLSGNRIIYLRTNRQTIGQIATHISIRVYVLGLDAPQERVPLESHAREKGRQPKNEGGKEDPYSSLRDSNSRPWDYETHALPTALNTRGTTRHCPRTKTLAIKPSPATPKGRPMDSCGRGFKK